MIVQKRFFTAIFLSSTPLEIMPLCFAGALILMIIPAEVIAPLGSESRYSGTGISNGVYFFGYLGWVTPSVGFPKDVVSRPDRG